MSLRFIDFFAGIGGFSLGLERAGHTCVGQVEIDEYCNKVLAKHWPNVPRWGDIRSLDCEELPEADLYIGGDPCQENSNARQTDGTSQPSLGREFLDVIAARCPSLVLRENPSVVRPDAPWPWWKFRSGLNTLGYDVLPFRLRACCFGFEHRRERLFLLGYLPDTLREGLERYEFKEVAGKTGKRICDLAKQNRRSTPPRICRAIDGVPNRMDRIRALENAVVPQVAEYIGRLLMEATE